MVNCNFMPFCMQRYIGFNRSIKIKFLCKVTVEIPTIKGISFTSWLFRLCYFFVIKYGLRDDGTSFITIKGDRVVNCNFMPFCMQRNIGFNRSIKIKFLCKVTVEIPTIKDITFTSWLFRLCYFLLIKYRLRDDSSSFITIKGDRMVNCFR